MHVPHCLFSACVTSDLSVVSSRRVTHLVTREVPVMCCSCTAGGLHFYQGHLRYFSCCTFFAHSASSPAVEAFLTRSKP